MLHPPLAMESWCFEEGQQEGGAGSVGGVGEEHTLWNLLSLALP